MLKKINTKSPALWATVLIATLGIAGFSTSALLGSNTSATGDNKIIATLTNPDIVKSTADTTDEMVYVITNKSGSTEKILANSFTENKLNETSVVTKTDLPVTFDLQYTLDGQAISADDLAGKSGHVTITYDFTNHQKYGNYQVPFATVTTAVLSEDFTNVTVTNGRVLDDGTRKVVLGLTFPGLNNNFNTDLDLPTSLEISADVKDFSLESTYTIATNQIFSNLDTSKLSTIDDLAGSMNQLSSSMSQLISGSTQLQNGLQQLLDKSGELTSGVNQLNDGLQTLSGKSGELNTGATQVFQGLIDQANNSLKNATLPNGSTVDLITYLGQNDPRVTTLTIQNYSTVFTAISEDLTTAGYPEAVVSQITAGKSSLDSYNKFYTSLQQYTTGVNQAAAGSQQLANNLPALTNGVTALRDGATQLTNSLNLFNQQGISQLVTAGNKAENFANDLRATVTASQSYTHYSQPKAEQVTFIYKTPEI